MLCNKMSRASSRFPGPSGVHWRKLLRWRSNNCRSGSIPASGCPSSLIKIPRHRMLNRQVPTRRTIFPTLHLRTHPNLSLRCPINPTKTATYTNPFKSPPKSHVKQKLISHNKSATYNHLPLTPACYNRSTRKTTAQADQHHSSPCQPDGS